MTLPDITPDTLGPILDSFDRADHREFYRSVLRTGVFPEIGRGVLNSESLVVLYHPSERSLHRRIVAYGIEGKLGDVRKIMQMGSQVRNGSPNLYNLFRYRGHEAVVTNEINVVAQGSYGDDGFVFAFKPQLTLGQSGRANGALALPRRSVRVLKQADLETQLASMADYLRSREQLLAGDLPTKRYTPSSS